MRHRLLYISEDELTDAQRMWIDVIHCVINQPRFDVKIGDMGYVINNMIAKLASSASYYFVTQHALQILRELELDLNQPIHIRKHVNGRDKKTLLEHLVPASIVRQEMLKSDRTLKSLTEIACNLAGVTVMSRDEDMLLRKSKLTRKMPEDWTGITDDALKRYRTAGIKLSGHKITWTGPICR